MSATAAIAPGVNASLKRLRREYAKQKTARDKIAAKRQAVTNKRAPDLRATVGLWHGLTASGLAQLCDAAVAACRCLGTTDDLTESLDEAVIANASARLQAVSLDPQLVYTDVTSYAAGEPNLVSATVSGALGRRIMQINDLHDHLDALNALAEPLHRTDDLGLMLRAALVSEVCSLVEQVLGPPTGSPSVRDGPPLIVLVSADRGQEGRQVLSDYAEKVIPIDTRVNLHALRNRVGAHIDAKLSIAEIIESLEAVSVDDLLMCADVTLDWLDAAARMHVDLGLLVIGHPQLASIRPSSAPTVPAAFQPEASSSLLDQPHMAMVVGGFGLPMSAGIAAVIARRAESPRERWLPIQAGEADLVGLSQSEGQQAGS